MKTDYVANVDALELLKSLPDGSVNCVVTSPPYYGLRDYGVDGQIGLEDTPQAFIGKLIAVFSEVRRVLRRDGVLFVNLGDSYATSSLEKSLRKRYNLRKDLTKDELNYVCMEMFSMRFNQHAQEGEGLVPEMLSTAIQGKRVDSRPRLLGAAIKGSIQEKPATVHRALNKSQAEAENGGDNNTGREMRVLRRDSYRILDGRPYQRRWRATQERDYREYTRQFNNDIPRYKAAGIPQREVSNSLYELQFLDRAIRILSSSNLEQELIPTHLREYFYSIPSLSSKNLLMIPARFAIAMQDDGWILRSECVWVKPNPMPESVTDRPTKSHEMVYLFAKSQRYFYDADAIREPHVRLWDDTNGGNLSGEGIHKANGKMRERGGEYPMPNPLGRNHRDVFTIATEPTPFAHFATFPQALIEPLILAGCPEKVCVECGMPYVREIEKQVTVTSGTRNTPDGKGVDVMNRRGLYPRATVAIKATGFKPTCACSADARAGIVLDPFLGSGTTALVARRLGRHYIGSELNAEYAALAETRLLHTSKEELAAALAGKPTTRPLWDT